MTTTYLSVTQTTDRIAALMLSTDQRRVAWASLSDPDKAVVAAQAQRDIDACKFRGARVEPDQGREWPRFVRDHRSAYQMSDTLTMTNSYLDPDPAGDGDAQVEGLPLAVKDAFAFQAAHRAAVALGLDATAHIEAAAARGVISQASGGVSETIDARRAASPWSRLCADAQRVLDGLRISGGAIV